MNYWAFLASPNMYRVEDAISDYELDTWTVEKSKVRIGDRAIIWKAKGGESHRGVVAFADVLSDPELRVSPHPEFFVNPVIGGPAPERAAPQMRVEIRYLVPDALPLWHDGDPNSLLGQLNCARATGGSIFKITPGQWTALSAMVGGLPEPSAATVGRNPAWARDELILALDLYFKRSPSQMSVSHPDVGALSKTLRGLPIHLERPDPSRYRNANGVYMKLSNFLRFDPSYRGKGLSAGGKAEEDIWKEFAGDRERLKSLAEAIRSGATELRSISAETIPPDDEDQLLVEAKEGNVLLKLHKVRERKPALVRAKKVAVKKKHKVLACEVCNFVFTERYGTLGEDFIECHHIKPVSQMKEGDITRLEDFALVCANCHRMLHRGGEVLSIEGLRGLLR